MKTIATLVAFATFIAAPAFAQAPPKATNAVTFSGRHVVADPDAAIRGEMRRGCHHYINGDFCF